MIQLLYFIEYTRERFPELDGFTIIKISSPQRTYKITSCTFIVQHEQGNCTLFKLYEADRNVITENWLVYTGNSKSCSFVIIPEKITNIFDRKFLYQKWYIEEIYNDCVFKIKYVSGEYCTIINEIETYETQNPLY